jgi:hypothetical protein
MLECQQVMVYSGAAQEQCVIDHYKGEGLYRIGFTLAVASLVE